MPIMVLEKRHHFLPRWSLSHHGCSPSRQVISLQLINFRLRNEDIIYWGKKKLSHPVKSRREKVEAGGQRGKEMRAQEKGREDRRWEWDEEEVGRGSRRG